MIISKKLGILGLMIGALLIWVRPGETAKTKANLENTTRDEKDFWQVKKEIDQEAEDIRKEITAKHPEYEKDTTGLAQEIVQRKIRIAQQGRFLKKEWAGSIEALYQKALGAYRKKDYALSYKYFNMIQDVEPNYRKTNSYLRHLVKRLGSPGPKYKKYQTKPKTFSNK